MGEVYLAEDLRLKRKAAIKLIAADLTREEQRRQRFLQEATLAASIDHPHIAKIYDIDHIADRTFIAMEYVHGATLRETLRNGQLPLRRAVDLAVQIGEALAKIHDGGIVHRDLKPENVLISEDGYAKVIDFGLAKLTERSGSSFGDDELTGSFKQVHTTDGQILGTIAYMSPEQARGQNVDARSDIFSFGALLYEMVSGVAPFRRLSPAETLSAILSETVPPVAVTDAAVAPEMQRIVRKCLVKDPAARYQSMADVVVDLRAVRESMSGVDSLGGLREAPRVFGRNAPRTIAIGAMTLLAVAGLVVGLISIQRKASPSPAAVAPRRPALAVLSFENVGSAPTSAWLSKGLPSMLVTGLAQTPDLGVVTSDRLNEAARQVGRDTFDAIEPGRLTEVAHRAGASVVVNGSIIQAGEELRIDARVEDLAAGRVLLAESVRGKDPLALADDLAARIRTKLEVRPEGTIRRVADLTSSSIEAYRLYSQGLQAVRNTRTDDARDLFEQAIALDPSFAMAYLQLSIADSFKGKLEEEHANLKRAEEHIDRLPERDALLVRAGLARSEGRTDEALRHYDLLMSKYPDEFDAYIPAGLLQPSPAKGVALMERAIKALPSSGELYNVLAYFLLLDGRPEDATALFEAYVRLRPNEPNALDSLAEDYLVLGEFDKALDLYGRAIKGGHSRTGRGWTLAVLGRYDEVFEDLDGTAKAPALARVGRYLDAMETLNRSAAGAERNQNKHAVALISLIRSSLELEHGDCANAARSVSVATQTLSGLPPVFDFGYGRPAGSFVASLILGTCDLRSGRLESARKSLEDARRTYQESFAPQRLWFHLLEGEFALAEKDPARAAVAFAAAEPQRKMPFNRTGEPGLWTLLENSCFPRDGVARARIAQGRFDDAIAIYRGLLTPGKTSKFTAFFEPRYVLALARLLERTGKRDAARTEYRRFLDYWKHADPDLPELAEARHSAS